MVQYCRLFIESDSYMQVLINYKDVSLADIKKEYHLDVICPQGAEQSENIALTIKMLYFYCDMLKSKYPSDIEALICRELIISSYSVIDGLVGCLGFKIQYQCYNCQRRCNCFSQSMFPGDARKNENEAFKNADLYLRATKIIDLTPAASVYYDNYRSARNNIHLTKNTNVITSDKRFTREHCQQAIEFLNGFIEMIYTNYINFVKRNGCNYNKRR